MSELASAPSFRERDVSSVEGPCGTGSTPFSATRPVAAAASHACCARRCRHRHRDPRIVALVGLAAPLLTPIDPAAINPSFRNKKPGAVATVRDDDGTKARSRTGWAPTRSGATSTRASCTVRASRWWSASLVALFSVAIGLVIGLVAGYVRWLDAIVMRIMDGLMAIPAILLAIALVSLSRAGLVTVIVAIVIPEMPRVVRLVRSIVLSVREEPYVEAAVAVGTPTPTLVLCATSCRTRSRR